MKINGKVKIDLYKLEKCLGKTLLEVTRKYDNDILILKFGYRSDGTDTFVEEIIIGGD